MIAHPDSNWETDLVTEFVLPNQFCYSEYGTANTSGCRRNGWSLKTRCWRAYKPACCRLHIAGIQICLLRSRMSANCGEGPPQIAEFSFLQFAGLQIEECLERKVYCNAMIMRLYQCTVIIHSGHAKLRLAN